MIARGAQRFPQLAEQSRVLDGNDGLGCEVFNQLDLFVGERTDLLAVDEDGADQLVVLEHRHCKTDPRAAVCRCRTGDRFRTAVVDDVGHISCPQREIERGPKRASFNSRVRASTCSCKSVVDACAVGAFRALSPNTPLPDGPLAVPRRLTSPSGRFTLINFT